LLRVREAACFPLRLSAWRASVHTFDFDPDSVRCTRRIKQRYNRHPIASSLLIALHAPCLRGVRWLVRMLTGVLTVERVMIWHDLIDWLGGYPFEVAKPGTVFRFFHDRGFILSAMTTCGGRMRCNEFVFKRVEN